MDQCYVLSLGNQTAYRNLPQGVAPALAHISDSFEDKCRKGKERGRASLGPGLKRYLRTQKIQGQGMFVNGNCNSRANDTSRKANNKTGKSFNFSLHFSAGGAQPRKGLQATAFLSTVVYKTEEGKSSIGLRLIFSSVQRIGALGPSSPSKTLCVFS